MQTSSRRRPVLARWLKSFWYAVETRRYVRDLVSKFQTALGNGGLDCAALATAAKSFIDAAGSLLAMAYHWDLSGGRAPALSQWTSSPRACAYAPAPQSLYMRTSKSLEFVAGQKDLKLLR
jgi:hypothetical protein